MLQYRTDLAMEAHELLCAKSRAQTRVTGRSISALTDR